MVLPSKKIIILATESDFTNMVYESVDSRWGVALVVIEEAVPKIRRIKIRLKKIGPIRVFGQLLFSLFIVPALGFFSKNRVKAIIKSNNLSVAPVPDNKIVRVSSVNSPEVFSLLQSERPDLVIVNGTRIISEKTLSAISGKFINMHVGITPMYRGVHGAYWALSRKDKEHCGVTIHFIDKGIDTGEILAQRKIDIVKEDNFVTYPYLQVAAGLLLYKEVLQKYFENKLESKKVVEGISELWYHPTLWYYLYNRILNGVK